MVLFNLFGMASLFPIGNWTKTKIVAMSWTQRESNELHLIQILPANYKPVDINDVIQNQTH